MKDGYSKLNDIFDSTKHDTTSKRTSDRDENSYKMQINANDMRRVILENQLEVGGSRLRLSNTMNPLLHYFLKLINNIITLHVAGGCCIFGKNKEAKETNIRRYFLHGNN
jgi:hypothetical protein